MEAVIATLIVLGVLSASGVLPEKSPPPANPESHASALETSDPVTRPACNPHDPVYRDLTVPYGQGTRHATAGKAEAPCDE